MYEKTIQKMEGLAPFSDSFDFDFEANASSIHLAEDADVSDMELALPVTSTPANKARNTDYPEDLMVMVEVATEQPIAVSNDNTSPPYHCQVCNIHLSNRDSFPRHSRKHNR